MDETDKIKQLEAAIQRLERRLTKAGDGDSEQRTDATTQVAAWTSDAAPHTADPALDEYAVDPAAALRHGNAAGGVCVARAVAAVARLARGPFLSFFFATADAPPDADLDHERVAWWLAAAVRDGTHATSAAKAATAAMTTTWAPHTGDGSLADAARLRRVVRALGARDVARCVGDWLAALRNVVAARPYGADLLRRADVRAAALFELAALGDVRTRRALVAADTVALLARHLSDTCATADDSVAATAEWATVRQQRGESVDAAVARLYELWRACGHAGAPTNTDVAARLDPALAARIDAHLVERIARAHVNKAVRDEAARVLARADRGEIVVDLAWCTAGTNTSRALLLALFTLAEREQRRHELVTTTAVPTARVAVRADVAAVEEEVATVRPAATPTRRPHAAAAAATVETPTNVDLVCAACQLRGHPFRLCPTATEEEKKEAAQRIYRRGGGRRTRAASKNE